MKKFVALTFTLAFICAVLALTINIVLDRLINNPEYFALPQDKSYIILGHSQPACSFDDTLINGFLNMATPMEGYFYTYYKTKKILECNNHVKGVFIEFSSNQISEWANN